MTGPPEEAAPEAAPRERISAAIRGSREARMDRSAEPSLLRFPLIRAEQEADNMTAANKRKRLFFILLL
jgi:hypothetical protein